MGLSNNITAILNFIALLCSIPIVASGLWLASKPDNECVHLFRWPVVVLGFFILVISLIGFVGAYWYKEGLLGLYLCCMAILITLLLIVLIFAFVVTRPDGSYWVPGRGYKEYRLDGFSSWLRGHVASDDYWPKIRNCLIDSNFCAKVNDNGQFVSSHMSPLQSGCCKPPTACGYQYVSPTMWINPTNPSADPDCSLWSSDPSMLCYGCSSCRAGLLGNLRNEWRKVNVILIVTVVVLIVVYVIACSAFRNAQTEDLFRKYKEGWT
ncbi:hypothetical protein RND81_14G214600 [Saponaria officinalis]|uniref:Tetraspanin-2 n=1 Tax=Saponaria officinalis TaxID=3572 RepID=A0AAW1GUU6_SAPOF